MCTKTRLVLDIRGSEPSTYTEKVLTPIVGHLRGFSKVQILVRPRKRSLKDRLEEQYSWESVRDFKAARAEPLSVVPFLDLLSTGQGPCADWWANIAVAFDDSAVQRIVYLPVDITYLDPPANSRVERLQSFIDKSIERQYDLLLGNFSAYTPVESAASFEAFLVPRDQLRGSHSTTRDDTRKNRLEAFAVSMFQALFPMTFAEFIKIRHDDVHAPCVRTGFFSLSRGLFDAFSKERRTMLPYAGTTQLLLCALIQLRNGDASFKIGEHFIGRLNQAAEDPADFAFEHQMLRVEYILRNELAFYRRRYKKLAL